MICCLVRVSPNTPPGALEAIGRACSPRVESHGPSVVMFDADGLGRVVGTPADIAREVTQLAVRQGLVIRVATGANVDGSLAARACRHRRGDSGRSSRRRGHGVVSVATAMARDVAGSMDLFRPRAGDTVRHWAQSVRHRALGTGHVRSSTRSSKFGDSRPSSRHYRMAPGPSLVSSTPRGSIGGRSSRRADNAQTAVFDLLATLERWGLRTLGDVARLPRADVHTRLGAPGVRLHQAARGEETALAGAGRRRAKIRRALCARLAGRRARAVVVRARPGARSVVGRARARRSRRGRGDDAVAVGHARVACARPPSAGAHARRARAADAHPARSRIASALCRHRHRGSGSGRGARPDRPGRAPDAHAAVAGGSVDAHRPAWRAHGRITRRRARAGRHVR